MAAAAGSRPLGGGARERSRELGRLRKGAACFHGESWRTSGQLEERVVSLAVGQGEDSGGEAVGLWGEGG